MVKSKSSKGVVIVGAGPVGLVLACELGRRGVMVRLVEQAPDLVRHPRANTMSARTMETFRTLGIAEEVRRQAPIADDLPVDVGYFTSLLGTELHRVSQPSARASLAASRVSDPDWPTAEPTLRATQMSVEPIVLKQALSYASVTVHFGHRFIDLTQSDHGVAVKLETPNGPETWQCDYLVGCDGGSSAVRKTLGIRFEGEDGLNMNFMGGRMLATHFRSPDLRDKFPHPAAWMHYIMLPAARSVMVTIDPEQADYLLHFQLTDDEVAGEDTFHRRLPDIVGADIACTVHSSGEWRAGRGLVARKFADGRVLLAGDAVHLFTPTGGFGMNTGVEDAVNLGWKLALVTRDMSPLTMLDTYQTERQPIARRNIDYALDFARNAGLCPVSDMLDDPGQQGIAARRNIHTHLARYAALEFQTLGVQLGARYDDSAIVLGNDDPAPDDRSDIYTPSTKPGGLLPHVWLADGRAMQDCLGPEFTLLHHGPVSDLANWRAAAATLGLTLDFQSIDTMYQFTTGAILVRPDRHIAWTGNPNEDASAILTIASGNTRTGRGNSNDL